MHKRYLYLIVPLLAATLLLSAYPTTVSPVYASGWPLPTPRDETVALCGYWPDPAWSTSVPCIMDWGQCMETYIMYEPMFGVDAATGGLIKWLGQDITWVNSTCIKVVLREGIYWVKITNWDYWVAGVGGVEYYRPITAEDVKYSFYLYGAFNESGAGYTPGVEGDGKYWHMGSLKDRLETQSMNDFVIESDRVFYIRLNPAFANSLIVWRVLTSGYLIVPADVWQEIEAAFPGWIPEVGNDWTDPEFRAAHPDWLVASGMYLPYMHQTVDWPHYTLMQKNLLWWGITVIGRQPAPNYFTNLHFWGNIPIYDSMRDGDIDWDGDYVPKDVWQPAGYKTYLFDEPYFIDQSVKILVPNYRRWPLGETWLIHAICHVLNFAELNEASEGYCKPPSPLYIPKDDAPGRRLLNTTIEDYFINEYFVGKYVGVPYVPDVQEATEILEAACLKHDGYWYTKDGPSEDWINRYVAVGDETYLQVGTVTKTASEWLATGFAAADELPDEPGINVKLGPWYLYDIVGWTDINAMSELIAKRVSDALGIPATYREIEYDDYESRMDTLSTDIGVTFDFAHFCMHAGINNEMSQRYGQFYNPPPGCYNNFGDLRNSTISDKLEELDTKLIGSPEEQAVANELQWLVGDDLPYVPTAGHPSWYLYLETYWVRWPNEKHAFSPAHPYGGSGNAPALHYILLSLGSVKCPTDLNNDHKVDMKDIGIACRAFGSYVGHPRWEFVADINFDGKVDMKDIGLICWHFGETW